MGRRSSIEQLPQALFDAINRALDENKTIDEIVTHMQALGADVSRSAVGRHKKKIDEVAAQLRKSRMIAEAIGKEFGDEPDDKMARLNVELLHDQIMRLVTAADDDGESVQMDAKELNFVADALYRLSSARKVDTDRVVKEREKMGKEVKKAIDRIAADAEGDGGAKPDAQAVLKRIREEVYGIFEAPKT